MSKAWTKLKKAAMKWIVEGPFGDIRVFGRPFFIVFGSTSHRLKAQAIRNVVAKAQAGDVLVTKQKTRLSTKFIPGYWTHAGIYMGAWKVIHAIPKKGVIEEDILNFLRSDEVAILRTEMTDNQREFALETASRQLGKPYDIVFEGKDDRAFYCFELIAIAFGLKRQDIITDKAFESNFEIVYDSRNPTTETIKRN